MNILEERINNLLKIKDGWFDGYGFAYKKEELDWLENIWETNVGNQLSPDFSPVPSEESSQIYIEYFIKRWDISLEIDLIKQTGFFHCLELDTDEEICFEEMDLNDPKEWEKIIDIIKSKEDQV
jgi:hypothetical protein